MDATQTTMYTSATLDGRRDICAAMDIWCDGHAAKIVGATCDFAMVIDLQTGADWEFAWSTVENIMNRDRRFKS